MHVETPHNVISKSSGAMAGVACPAWADRECLELKRDPPRSSQLLWDIQITVTATNTPKLL